MLGDGEMIVALAKKSGAYSRSGSKPAALCGARLFWLCFPMTSQTQFSHTLWLHFTEFWQFPFDDDEETVRCVFSAFEMNPPAARNK